MALVADDGRLAVRMKCQRGIRPGGWLQVVRERPVGGVPEDDGASRILKLCEGLAVRRQEAWQPHTGFRALRESEGVAPPFLARPKVVLGTQPGSTAVPCLPYLLPDTADMAVG